MASGEDKQFRWSQSIPDDWLPYLDKEAERNGMTRVGFVRELIRSAIPERVRKNLSEPQAAGRPKSSNTKEAN